MMNPMDEFGRLKELVRQHKVGWEVWPVYHVNRKGEKVQIGFELELAGPIMSRKSRLSPVASNA